MSVPRPQPARPTLPAQIATWLVGLFGLWQGATIWISDDVRFATPGYALARQVPGGMNAWGVVAVAAGVGVLVGVVTRNFWIKVAALALLAVWCIFFGLANIGAAAAYPSAGPTGGPTYVIFGLVIMCLSLYRDRREGT